MSWKDETALWEYQFPRLRGWWRRLEAATPEGMPDSFGLYDARTWWLERKVGKPSMALLRPKQVEFGLECMHRGVKYHVCFGYQGRVYFFDTFAFTAPVDPKYWKPRLGESATPPWPV